MLLSTGLGVVSDCSVFLGLSVAPTYGSESWNPTELVLSPCHVRTHRDWEADALMFLSLLEGEPSMFVSQALGKPSSFITRWGAEKGQGCVPLSWY